MRETKKVYNQSNLSMRHGGTILLNALDESSSKKRRKTGMIYGRQNFSKKGMKSIKLLSTTNSSHGLSHLTTPTVRIANRESSLTLQRKNQQSQSPRRPTVAAK